MKLKSFLRLGSNILFFSAAIASANPYPARSQAHTLVSTYDYYAAFAYSESTDRGGSAWAGYSRHAAEGAALRSCRGDGAADCIVVGLFVNKCGSLASSPEGIYGIGYGGLDEIAAERALANCQERGGTSCRVRRAMCANDPA